MLTVGIVGIGNAGSQVAALAKERLAIDVLAINSSEKDLETVPQGIKKHLIGDKKGAGKERRKSKEFLKDSIMEMIGDEEVSSILDKDVLFIVSSTGGGTGSGSSIILADILGEVFVDTKIIVVGILPTLNEGFSTQTNTLEYMEELYNSIDGLTYMLYDNDKLSKQSTKNMMENINLSIVNDIDVIRGTYQLPTKYSSIDERDMSNIISTSGRMVIASVRDIKEKDIDEVSLEDLLITQFKTNAHAELQRDKIVHRTGVIVNLSERINETFDSHIQKVQEFIGSPVEEFEHITINTDRHIENNVFLIATGLSKINDRIRKIKERIEEINEKQAVLEDENELEDVNLSEMKSKIERKKTSEDSSGNVDIKSIFGKYGL